MGKFKDMCKIGSGGFGEVFKSKRLTDGKVFARKELLDDDDDEAIRRFQNEVRLIKTLDHPAIIKVTGIHLSEPPYWYLMPFYEYSLRDKVEEISGEEPTVLAIFSKVLEAVQYAHGEGIIHRDLKPENILLTENFDVVVTDFGLGRSLNSGSTRITQSGYPLGTAGYMAPEQYTDGKEAVQSSDIFALGMILSELYTGDLPIGIGYEEDLPPAIAMIVKRCTKRDPDDRFESVAEIRDAIRKLMSAESEDAIRQELDAILIESQLSGKLESRSVIRLSKLIGIFHQDADVLHELCMKLPSDSFNKLWSEDSGATTILIKGFANHVVSQVWGYAYTDSIADACVKIYNELTDGELKASILFAVAKVGTDHNRWYVMEKAGTRLQTVNRSKEVRKVIVLLEEDVRCLEKISGYVDVNEVKNAEIRKLFLRHPSDED